MCKVCVSSHTRALIFTPVHSFKFLWLNRSIEVVVFLRSLASLKLPYCRQQRLCILSLTFVNLSMKRQLLLKNFYLYEKENGKKVYIIHNKTYWVWEDFTESWELLIHHTNVQLSAKKRPMVEISSLCYLKGHVDNAIHWINCYSVDNVACFVNTYLLDSN